MKLSKWRRLLIWMGVFIGISVIIRSPETVEQYYSRGLYPLLVRSFAPLVSLVDISLGEVLLLLLAFGGLYLIIRNWRLLAAWGFKKTVWVVAESIFVVIIVFQLVWGLNYSRMPMKDTLNLDVHPRQAQEVYETLIFHIERAGALREKLDMRVAPEKINLWMGFENLPEAYDPFKVVAGRAKPLVSSVFFSYAGISGIYNPFLAEPNYNALQRPFMKPVVMAHEIAHLQGVAREDEANFIAVMACISHQDAYVQYSGHLLAVIHLLGALYDSDQRLWLKARKQITPDVEGDLISNNAFWRAYDGWFEEVSSDLNDTYLKANGQQDGIMSYGRMVDLLLAVYEQGAQ